MADNTNRLLTEALWKIYRRPDRPQPWVEGGNLPWDEPGFSKRMLREHLDQSHGAASRTGTERTRQVEWLWTKLHLGPEARLFDVTCGPGLYAVEFARRGCRVTGIDFSPASIDYARQLAKREGIAARCDFLEQDVRRMADTVSGAGFDGALLLYGQLAVFTKIEARTLLTSIAHSLRPGGRLCVELLDQAKVDKSASTWWFTDDTGLWGDRPFLHLGERFWDESEKTAMERYHLLHLETGVLDEILLCDQTYSVGAITRLLVQAGFGRVEVFPNWGDLPLYDAGEWVVYVAEK